MAPSRLPRMSSIRELENSKEFDASVAQRSEASLNVMQLLDGSSSSSSSSSFASFGDERHESGDEKGGNNNNNNNNNKQHNHHHHRHSESDKKLKALLQQSAQDILIQAKKSSKANFYQIEDDEDSDEHDNDDGMPDDSSSVDSHIMVHRTWWQRFLLVTVLAFAASGMAVLGYHQWLVVVVVVVEEDSSGNHLSSEQQQQRDHYVWMAQSLGERLAQRMVEQSQIIQLWASLLLTESTATNVVSLDDNTTTTAPTATWPYREWEEWELQTQTLFQTLNTGGGVHQDRNNDDPTSNVLLWAPWVERSERITWEAYASSRYYQKLDQQNNNNINNNGTMGPDNSVTTGLQAFVASSRKIHGGYDSNNNNSNPPQPYNANASQAFLPLWHIQPTALIPLSHPLWLLDLLSLPTVAHAMNDSHHYDASSSTSSSMSPPLLVPWPQALQELTVQLASSTTSTTSSSSGTTNSTSPEEKRTTPNSKSGDGTAGWIVPVFTPITTTTPSSSSSLSSLAGIFMIPFAWQDLLMDSIMVGDYGGSHETNGQEENDREEPIFLIRIVTTPTNDLTGRAADLQEQETVLRIQGHTVETVSNQTKDVSPVSENEALWTQALVAQGSFTSSIHISTTSSSPKGTGDKAEAETEPDALRYGMLALVTFGAVVLCMTLYDRFLFGCSRRHFSKVAEMALNDDETAAFANKKPNKKNQINDDDDSDSDSDDDHDPEQAVLPRTSSMRSRKTASTNSSRKMLLLSAHSRKNNASTHSRRSSSSRGKLPPPPRRIPARSSFRRHLTRVKSNLHNFLLDNLHESSYSGGLDFLEKTKPIADLFPATTIMFADLVGFTAWSSARDPTQVFRLLETIYFHFDELAKQRGVFKVETVGDCYVAVAGLPTPRKDHAVAMARFARDCLLTFYKVVKKLDVELGPDTSDLLMRIGLHSGQTTAGVLRGDRARFQLFGDTVNTASRMESTGKPGMIQVSKETADQLEKSGKDHWIRPREELVYAKGKGELQTYWLEMTAVLGASTSSTGGLSDESNVESESTGGDRQMRQLPSQQKLKRGISIEELHIEDMLVNEKEKHSRLIDWNTDLLAQLLKKVVGRRASSRNNRGDAWNAIKKIETETMAPDKQVIDEVVDVIDMPDYSFISRRKRDRSTVMLNPTVMSQLRAYVETISFMYRENPFHNFEHASHVVMSVNKLLGRIVAPDMKFNDSSDMAVALHDHTYGITSDPLTQFTLVLAALIHDVDHTGLPNSQLVREQTPIASAYRNRSVAEQNSVDLAWSTLMESQFKDLRQVIYHSVDELLRFRRLLVNAVMATDIMDRQLRAQRKARWDKAFDETAKPILEKEDTDRKATIVIEHIIQASDVAHTMQHWHIYRKWNLRLFDEMFSAFCHGRAETDPSEDWYQNELNFFDFYIIPLARKLNDCGVFGVSSDECLNYAEMNRNEWAKKGRELVAEMVESLRNGSVRRGLSLKQLSLLQDAGGSSQRELQLPRRSSLDSSSRHLIVEGPQNRRDSTGSRGSRGSRGDSLGKNSSHHSSKDGSFRRGSLNASWGRRDSLNGSYNIQKEKEGSFRRASMDPAIGRRNSLERSSSHNALRDDSFRHSPVDMTMRMSRRGSTGSRRMSLGRSSSHNTVKEKSFRRGSLDACMVGRKDSYASRRGSLRSSAAGSRRGSLDSLRMNSSNWTGPQTIYTPSQRSLDVDCAMSHARPVGTTATYQARGCATEQSQHDYTSNSQHDYNSQSQHDDTSQGQHDDTSQGQHHFTSQGQHGYTSAYQPYSKEQIADNVSSCSFGSSDQSDLEEISKMEYGIWSPRQKSNDESSPTKPITEATSDASSNENAAANTPKVLPDPNAQRTIRRGGRRPIATKDVVNEALRRNNETL